MLVSTLGYRGPCVTRTWGHWTPCPWLWIIQVLPSPHYSAPLGGAAVVMLLLLGELSTRQRWPSLPVPIVICAVHTGHWGYWGHCPIRKLGNHQIANWETIKDHNRQEAWLLTNISPGNVTLREGSLTALMLMLTQTAKYILCFLSSLC